MASQTQITELTQVHSWDRSSSDSEPDVHRVTCFVLCPALHPLLSQWKKCPPSAHGSPLPFALLWSGFCFLLPFQGLFPADLYHLLFHIFILSPWGSFLTATDMRKPFLKTNWQRNHLIHPPSPSSYHPQLTFTIRSFFFFDYSWSSILCQFQVYS